MAKPNDHSLLLSLEMHDQVLGKFADHDFGSEWWKEHSAHYCWADLFDTPDIKRRTKLEIILGLDT